MRRMWRRWRQFKRWQKILSVMGITILTGGLAFYLWIFVGLPSIDQLHAGLALPSTRIYDRNNRLLYEVIDPNGGRNTAVPLSRVPKALIQATIATEDRNFYSTAGIDLEGMIRALWINVQGGEIRAGGSTITQQVVRNLLLDPQQRSERTLRRKLREMVLAVRLAQSYSHDDILALYLNQTYYGNLAYGVQAAAQVYFNKNVEALTLAECALLAGLPQSPATHDPLTNPQIAKDRQKVVLDLMVEGGYISRDEADAAAKEPLQYGSGRFEIKAPHFVQTVWQQLQQDYPDAVYQGGLEVTTTVDLDWQQAAEEAVKRQIAALNQSTGSQLSHNVHSAALVAIDPHSGQILTMLGNADYFDEASSGAVNMAMAPRQPGSTLKPFTYALSFDPAQPDPWTPATMLLDVSTPFVTKQLQSYTPANYGLVEHGPVLIREALASSYNIPAVVALEHVGIDHLLNLLHRLGITTLNDPSRIGLSVTLGGGEVRLLDLTTAYAAFANDGRPVKTSMLLQVKDKDGKILYQWQPPPVRDAVIDPRVVFLITNILSDNEARIPAFGSHSALQIGRPAAAKTGTTTDFRDNWTMGYTPDLVVGVWAGNADNTPMHDVSGVTGAGPIWNEFMRTVLKSQPERQFDSPPPGVVQAEVCAASGLLPTPLCPQRRLDWFIAGTMPNDYDTMFQKFTIDRRTGLLADDHTPSQERVDKIYKVLPQEAHLWGLKHGIEVPPLTRQAVAKSGIAAARLLTPDPYTVYQLSPTIPFDAQKIRLSVAVPLDTKQVDYWLNDKLIDSVQANPWWTWWALTPGKYTLKATATLADGTTQMTDPVYFSVNSYVAPDEQSTTGEVK